MHFLSSSDVKAFNASKFVEKKTKYLFGKQEFETLMKEIQWVVLDKKQFIHREMYLIYELCKCFALSRSQFEQQNSSIWRNFVIKLSSRIIRPCWLTFDTKMSERTKFEIKKPTCFLQFWYLWIIRLQMRRTKTNVSSSNEICKKKAVN